MRDTANSTDSPRTGGLPAPPPDGVVSDPAENGPARVAPWLPPAGPGRAPAAPESIARPAPDPAADLAPGGPRRRWVVLAFALSFLIYLALIPRIVIYSSPPTGDQAFYLMVVASIVEDHDLNIANNYAAREEDRFYALAPHPADFVGMSAPYPLPPLTAFSTARPPTEKYDFRQPGLPLLIAPAYEIGSWFQLWWPATVVFMCLLGALVGANIFLLAYELTGRLGIAWAVWLPLAFSSPIMSYTFLLFTELPTALLVLYAFRRLAQGWEKNGPLRLLLVGLCIGYIPWMSWRCAPVAAGLGLYVLVQWWRALRPRRAADAAPGPGPRWAVWRRPAGSWAFVLLPLLASGGLLAWFNLFLFGRLTPPDRVPELSDTSPFLWPWESAQAFTNFVTTGFGLLFDRVAGLLPYTPLYVLAIVGIIAMFRSGRGADRRLLFWMAVVALPYVGLIMAYLLWTGLWGPPSRFLTVVTPLLAGPLAMSLLALSRSWIYRGIYALLALPGLFFMAIMMRDPRMLWPANSIFAWLAGAPDSWLHVDLRPALPLFSPIDELTLPQDTGWMTVAIVLIVLVSYLLLLWRGTLRPARPLPYAAHGAIWMLALLLVGSSWWTMNADALKHRTALVPQRTWTFQPPMAEPLGITYLNGVLYMADYTGRAVGALDLRTGAYRRIQPVLGQTAIPWTHPGDIKVGPDNLLYVLNNGPGPEALLAMQPDGKVLREIPLNGKADIATGLDFGPNGNIFIADMRGGRLRVYPPGGGAPLANYAGQGNGFNNVGGVTVAPDGTIYATEIGPRTINELAPDGHFVRAFDLGCISRYTALQGDWLDASCDAGGLWSINTRTGEMQRSRVAGSAPALDKPTGLTYGPDGLLYVLDGNTVRAFKVAH